MQGKAFFIYSSNPFTLKELENCQPVIVIGV